LKSPAPGPAVALRARLGEMMECWLEACCGQCRSHTYIPIKLLARTYGEGMPIGAILGRLSCKRCSTAQQRVRPSEVWLNEEPNRQPRHGAPPGWSVQLIGETVSGSIQDRGADRTQA
jgi:hypothetical protein